MDSGLLLLSDDAANALRAEGTDMAQFEVREEAQAIESGVGPIVFPPESVDVSPAHPPQADARRSPRPFVPPPDPVADVEGDGAPYADEGYSG